MRFCCAHSNNLNWDPIQNQASGRSMESYLPVCFLTLAVSLPLGLKPEKKGQGITSLNGPCLHQIYIGQCDRMGFVWLEQKRSANIVKIVPVQECWWKTPNKLLAVSLSVSCSNILQLRSKLLVLIPIPFSVGTGQRKSYSCSHWAHAVALIWKIISEAAWTINVIFIFYFFPPLSFPHHHSFFTLPLSNSFTLSGEDLPEALRERSAWEIWPVCPFHA